MQPNPENNELEFVGPASSPRDLVNELLSQGKALHFPFTMTFVDTPVACADGGLILQDVDEDDDDPTHGLGELDLVGFLVRRDGSEVVFRPTASTSAMGWTSVDEIEDFAGLEMRMNAFLDRFVI